MPVTINIHGDSADQVISDLACLLRQLTSVDHGPKDGPQISVSADGGNRDVKPTDDGKAATEAADVQPEAEKPAAKKPGRPAKGKKTDTPKFTVVARDGNATDFDSEATALEALSEIIRGAESLDDLKVIGDANSGLAKSFSQDAKTEAMDVFAEMRAELTPEGADDDENGEADESADGGDEGENDAGNEVDTSEALDAGAKADKPVTLDDMKAKMIEFCDAFTFDDARKLLNAFGVEKGDHIPAEHFGTVIKIIDQSLAVGKTPNFEKVAAAYGQKKAA